MRRKPTHNLDRAMEDKANSLTLAIAYYNSARSELIERIKLRDQTLSLYILAMGAYLGFVWTAHFGHQEKPVSVLDFIIIAPMPLICLAFTLIIIQHHILIGRLGLYLGCELDEDIRKTGINIRQWDNSSTLTGVFDSTLNFRFWEQAIILALPSGYDIAFFVFSLRSRNFDEGAFVIGISFTLATALAFLWIFYIHIAASRTRKKYIVSLQRLGI